MHAISLGVMQAGVHRLREACPVRLRLPAGLGLWVSELTRWASGSEVTYEGDFVTFEIHLPESEIKKYEQVTSIEVERLRGPGGNLASPIKVV